MDRKTLTLFGVGIALLIASAGMYAQPPVEDYQSPELELDNTNQTTLMGNQTSLEEPNGYVPAEDKWWSVSTSSELNDPLQEEPPATALSEDNSESFVITTGIAGLLLIVSGSLKSRSDQN